MSIDVVRLVIGFCLLALGALWTAANLGWLDLLDALHAWWPASLIFWGLLELYVTLSHADRGRSEP